MRRARAAPPPVGRRCEVALPTRGAATPEQPQRERHQVPFVALVAHQLIRDGALGKQRRLDDRLPSRQGELVVDHLNAGARSSEVVCGRVERGRRGERTTSDTHLREQPSMMAPTKML